MQWNLGCPIFTSFILLNANRNLFASFRETEKSNYPFVSFIHFCSTFSIRFASVHEHVYCTDVQHMKMNNYI